MTKSKFDRNLKFKICAFHMRNFFCAFLKRKSYTSCDCLWIRGFLQKSFSVCKNVISYFCESAANDNIKGSLISTFHVSQPGQTLLQSGIFRKSTLATIRGNNERESLEGTFVLPVSFVILFPTLFDQVL